MANIDKQLEIIKGGSERGEDVRNAIAEAIELIYKEREYPPTTLNVKNNGTVEGGPWNKVVVNVPGGGIDVGRIDSCRGDITENGWYTIEKLKDIGLIASDECIGTDGFTVNVGQKTGEYGEITITENGTYDPLLDGYDGYSKVHVNVLGGAIKDNYTVRFFDGKTLKEVKSVPRGTNAVYTGGALSGNNFTGWNPSPVSVSRDMDCYAVYGGSSIGGDIYDRYSETIMDSWAQIIQKVGSSQRPYEPGSTKHLALRGYNNAEFLLNMCLIGYNTDKDENGKYVSTWININDDITASSVANNIIGCFSLSGKADSGNTNNSLEYEYLHCHSNTIWWGSSLMRALWNGDKSGIIYDTNPGNDDLSYYNSMAAQNLLLPGLVDAAAGTSLFSNIKRVTKYSSHNQLTNNGTSYRVSTIRNKITKDKIWLASMREIAYPLYDYAGNPLTNLPSEVCSMGAADSGNTQYGNPNTFGKIITKTDSSNWWMTRDACHSLGTYGNNTAMNSVVAKYSIGSPRETYMQYYTGYSAGHYTSTSPVLLGFCI